MDSIGADLKIGQLRDELAAAKQELARMRPVFGAAVEYVKIQNEGADLWVDLCTDTDEIEESDNRQYTQFLKLSTAVGKLDR